MKLRELWTWKQYATQVISIESFSTPVITRQFYTTVLVHCWSKSCTHALDTRLYQQEGSPG